MLAWLDLGWPIVLLVFFHSILFNEPFVSSSYTSLCFSHVFFPEEALSIPQLTPPIKANFPSETPIVADLNVYGNAVSLPLFSVAWAAASLC